MKSNPSQLLTSVRWQRQLTQLNNRDVDQLIISLVLGKQKVDYCRFNTN